MSSGLSVDATKKIGGFAEYEIDSAADTLIRAEEVKADKKLYPLAMKKVKEKAKAATKAAEIKQKLADVFND